MKLKNVLITVDDMERAKEFYCGLMKMDILLEREGNVMLSGGLVLQERSVWERYTQMDIISENNASLIYFEENSIDDFAAELEKRYPETVYIKRPEVAPWGQKIMVFFDPDGNLIEVRDRTDGWHKADM